MEHVKRRDIFYADLSPVVGSEQVYVRPVLVLQNDIGNVFSPTTIVAAITSKIKKPEMPTHVVFTHDSLYADSMVMLEQIRTIDKCRLIMHIGKLDKKTMELVDRAMIASLGIKRWEELLR